MEEGPVYEDCAWCGARFVVSGETEVTVKMNEARTAIVWARFYCSKEHSDLDKAKRATKH